MERIGSEVKRNKIEGEKQENLILIAWSLTKLTAALWVAVVTIITVYGRTAFVVNKKAALPRTTKVLSNFVLMEALSNSSLGSRSLKWLCPKNQKSRASSSSWAKEASSDSIELKILWKFYHRRGSCYVWRVQDVATTVATNNYKGFFIMVSPSQIGSCQ